MFCYHMFLPINLMCSLQATAPYQPTAWAAAHCKGILNICNVVTLAKLISTDEILSFIRVSVLLTAETQ